jgi:hypothetical protein
MLPTFIVPGAAKSGTTALWAYLSEHPDVCMAAKKEPAFFSDVRSRYQTGNPSDHTVSGEYSKGMSWYEGLYQGCSDSTARGEASTLYFHARDAPAKIKRHVPRVKLVFILRHPVERLYSHYWQGKRSAHGLPESFRKFACSDNPHYDEYSDVSHYKKNIKRFKNYFDQESIKILTHADLIERPVEVMQSVYRFIEVDGGYEPERVGERFNKMEIPKFPLLVKMRRKITSKRWLMELVPKKIRQKAKSFIKNSNYRDFDYPPMESNLRADLIERFREDVEFVERETGKDLELWKQ